MIILVISHTEHFRDNENRICGWSSTVREIDFLAETYGQVIHVACFDATRQAPGSTSPYKSANVRFVPIPTYGGPGLKDKIKILTTAPGILRTVFRQLKVADIFQFRAPTSMGIYLIPALTWLSSKKGWFKYAGNWMQQNAPLSYAFQKNFLESYQRRPVTINGRWEGQKKHVHTFENPSLSDEDLEAGKQAMQAKNYEGPLTACFVGRLEAAKGVDDIIRNLSQLYDLGVREIHFAGDSEQLEKYKAEADAYSVRCHFHGFVNREKVAQLYAMSHLILLPSASEGFPKVIAEGANYGCVPIVSAVSSIPQYINDENGFLWDREKSDFSEFLKGLNLQADALKQKAQNVNHIAGLFSFKAYADKWEQSILKK